VAASDPLYRDVSDYSQVFPHTVRGIEHFFAIYKNLEGKKTEMAGWADAEAARKIVMEGHKRFKW
jgi:inorganic pyrophosphatase